MTYKIYTNDGVLFKTESSYESVFEYIREDLDKFVVFADGINNCGFRIYCRLPYIFDVFRYGRQLTSDHFDCDGERFAVKTFVYDTHFYHIYMKNGTYKHFYKLD